MLVTIGKVGTDTNGKLRFPIPLPKRLIHTVWNGIWKSACLITPGDSESMVRRLQ